MSGPARDKHDNLGTSSSDPRTVPQGSWAQFHLRIGWWSLLIFLSWGIVLEGLLAYGWEFYSRPQADMNRLMWRLAHVHGILLGVVHIVFGISVHLAAGWNSATRRIASLCLVSAGLLLPLGFLLGGLFAADGDPSLGVALVPLGALLLFTAVLLTARGMSGR